MVRGKMVMRLYDDNGNITDEFVMASSGSATEPVEVSMVHVEAGQWHSLEVLEEDILGRAFILSFASLELVERSKEGKRWEV